MNSTDTEKALDWYFLHVEAVDVAVRRWLDGRPVMLHPAKRPWQAGLGRDGLVRLLPWLRHENAGGADIYLRPARTLAAVRLVFLDDLVPAFAARVADKYSALIVETSPGSAQAWVAANRALVERERLAIQRAIATACRADPGSVSGEHFGRLPGFSNCKPTHPERPWVTVSAATNGAALNPEPWLAPTSDAHPITTPRVPPAVHRSAGDDSAEDWRIARHGLELGIAADRIASEIAARAQARGKRSTVEACMEYAVRTVQRAMCA